MDTLLACGNASESEDKKEKVAANAQAENIKNAAEKNINGINENPPGVLSLKKLVALVEEIIRQNDQKGDGWANYGCVYKDLCQRENTFNPRNYGVNKRAINFFRELPGKPFTIEIGPKLQRIRANKHK
jgi:hypothetical protein